ncbi:MAG TPA: Uma2 family endonuclease [Planctomycetaceae bacterium]|jgi:Uma2 family endonuclease
MSADDVLTAEQFAATRHELPDGGRWTELIAGRPVLLSPPSVEHGNAVLNLGKALADFSQSGQGGYACFDLGLVIARNPDTVLFPAACFFWTGAMFAESDKIVTEARPTLIVEVASSNDRRRGLTERIGGWLNWGASLVWLFDPHARTVHVFEKERAVQPLAEHEFLNGGSVLPGFQTSVGNLLKEPGWWK